MVDSLAALVGSMRLLCLSLNERAPACSHAQICRCAKARPNSRTAPRGKNLAGPHEYWWPRALSQDPPDAASVVDRDIGAHCGYCQSYSKARHARSPTARRAFTLQ